MPRFVDQIEPPQPASSIGLYVHVPFCRVKCGYCDFYSQVGGPETFEPLVEALLAELDTRVVRPGLAVETIYIGGGTPTVLPIGLLERLLGALRDAGRGIRTTEGVRQKGFPPELGCGKGFPHQRPHQLVEFTVEANPATVDDCKAALLAECGVDRVSMGAQSFDTGELAVLDREHRPADVAASIEILRRAGLTRFNLDLIFGVPGQTVASWLGSLRAAIDLEPEHLSCYGLTYEAGTPLHARREAGRVRAVDEDAEAEMYLATMETLEAAGYRQYEISNYARPGRECRHNLRYWHNLPGVGLGPSAASYLDGRRWRNVPDTREYVRLMQQGDVAGGR